MSKNLPKKELIIAIIEKDDSVLMRKKPEGSPPYKETWYLFGCEPIDNQDNSTTIKNYLKGDLGIDVEVGNELIAPDFEIKQDHDGIEKNFIYINLRCKYLGGTPKIPKGAERIEWIPKDKLLEYALVPPSKKLLRKLYRKTGPKIITISLPEYTIDEQPIYSDIGAKIDKAMAENFEGTYLVRELSITDHPQYSLDQLTDIILKTGADKYDPNRKGVAHEEFEPYKPDLQAGKVIVKDGKIVGEPFGEDIKRFYENAMLDRGYRLRIDLIVIYNPEYMVQAEKLDHTKPSTEPHLEQYLWRFKNPDNKPEAVIGIIKILK